MVQQRPRGSAPVRVLQAIVGVGVELKERGNAVFFESADQRPRGRFRWSPRRRVNLDDGGHEVLLTLRAATEGTKSDVSDL
jgi:hypothetical protein